MRISAMEARSGALGSRSFNGVFAATWLQLIR